MVLTPIFRDVFFRFSLTKPTSKLQTTTPPTRLQTLLATRFTAASGSQRPTKAKIKTRKRVAYSSGLSLVFENRPSFFDRWALSTHPGFAFVSGDLFWGFIYIDTKCGLLFLRNSWLSGLLEGKSKLFKMWWKVFDYWLSVQWLPLGPKILVFPLFETQGFWDSLHANVDILILVLDQLGGLSSFFPLIKTNNKPKKKQSPNQPTQESFLTLFEHSSQVSRSCPNLKSLGGWELTPPQEAAACRLLDFKAFKSWDSPAKKNKFIGQLPQTLITLVIPPLTPTKNTPPSTPPQQSLLPSLWAPHFLCSKIFSAVFKRSCMDFSRTTCILFQSPEDLSRLPSCGFSFFSGQKTERLDHVCVFFDDDIA